MSGKLDQSLDQIMTDSKATRGRKTGKPRARRAADGKAKPAVAAPVGGIQKKARAGKPAAPIAPAAAPPRESKIIVSNLPEDVSEGQIKDYFTQTVGAVKKVFLTYGPNGRSRGVATIIFGRAESAPKAAKDLHGVKVDGKPMKIEVVLGAQYAPAAPVPRSLAERASLPKSAATKSAATKPKPKTAAKGKTATTANAASKEKKAGRAGRPKKKSAAELDAEMADYFGDSGAANGTTAGAAAPAPAGGDAAMVDEVM